MRSSPLGFEMVTEKGYAVFTPLEEPFNYEIWLQDVLERTHAQVLVLDVRDDLPRAVVERIRRCGVLIVSLDDSSERRLAADLAFYPPVPQAKRLDWSGFRGELHVGWEWVVLRREFAAKSERVEQYPPTILVSMGGSDPAGLTLMALEALDLLADDFQTIVVLGKGFQHHLELESFFRRARRKYDVRHDVKGIAGLMATADLAIASFGITAYELAAMGVPSIYLCLTTDHAESASAFVHAGIGVSLGVYDQVSKEKIRDAASGLLNNPLFRKQMSERAFALCDGRGMSRTANKIMERINGNQLVKG